ncbi:MAG: inorganic phosphate transporter [Desulfovibrio sp.]|jgi:PiT family inorganic phosphate transporter|nr:inorganic phosphate transporter [Desulfovibrio sp.]
MDLPSLILLAATFGAFFMAFSLGANDVANSMATPVSARALTLRQAVILSSLLNFLGAVFLGSQVATTIARGIISPESVPDQNIFMLGMFATLLSSGLWVLIATYTALPVSSTHSIVGSLMGFGLATGGPAVVQWSAILSIVASWLLSPLICAAAAFVIFFHIRKTILFNREMLRAALRWMPFWIALTVVSVVLSLCFKTPFGKALHLSGWAGISLAAGAAVVTVLILRAVLPKLLARGKAGDSPARLVDGLFRRMQVGTACYVALAHGANDVSNAVGPVVAIYFIATTGSMAGVMEIPFWLLALGGGGIAAGTLLMGRKVMDTVGERITQMNNSRGFVVALSSAATVLIASNMGLPISTTHATVGSVVGVGLARGFYAVDFRVLARIFLFWILTLPISAGTCIAIFYLLRLIFL